MLVLIEKTIPTYCNHMVTSGYDRLYESRPLSRWSDSL